MTHEITVKEMAELEGRDISLVVRGLRSVRRAPEDVKIGSYERMTDAEALDAIVEQYAQKYWHILRGAK